MKFIAGFILATSLLAGVCSGASDVELRHLAERNQEIATNLDVRLQRLSWLGVCDRSLGQNEAGRRLDTESVEPYIVGSASDESSEGG